MPLWAGASRWDEEVKSGEPVFDGSPDAQKAQSSRGRWRRSGQKRTKVAVASSARLAWPNFAGVGKIRLEGENGDGKAWKRGSQQMRQESARQLPTEWKMKRSDLKLDRTECRIAAAAGTGQKGSSCPNLVMKRRKGRPSSSCTTKKGWKLGGEGSGGQIRLDGWKRLACGLWLPKLEDDDETELPRRGGLPRVDQA